MKFKKLKLALAMSLSIMSLTATSIKAEELIVGSFLPGPHHLHTRVFEWFNEQIKEKSSGDLSTVLFPGGQLGAGPVQQYKRALENVADLTLGVSAYTPTIFPRSMLAILPGKSETAVDSTNRIWDAYDEHLSQEYKDVKLIGLFTVAGNVLAATRDVSTLEGLAGAKIVPYAAMTKPLIEAAGAVPVQMPITEVYTGLSTGTIDAAYVSISNMSPPWNFWDVTTHMVEGSPVNFAVLFVVMNKERYEGLSDEHRAIIDSVAGRPFSLKAAESFDLADELALKAMAENPERMKRVNRINVTAENRAAMDEANLKGLDILFKDYKDRGIDNAQEIYEALNK
ncbi:MAG: TRAP transporter substrate-binding protein [OCS116 cluster bacterium]|nr:TRAP transporter substrate-binding protein [OCS116 cluster bacterium]